MKTETFHTIAAAAHKTTYAGAAGGFWGWLTSNATLGLIGALIALCGLIVNFIYKRKADQRAEHESNLAAQESQLRLHERRMRIALLQTQIDAQGPETAAHVAQKMCTIPEQAIRDAVDTLLLDVPEILPPKEPRP